MRTNVLGLRKHNFGINHLLTEPMSGITDKKKKYIYNNITFTVVSVTLALKYQKLQFQLSCDLEHKSFSCGDKVMQEVTECRLHLDIPNIT